MTVARRAAGWLAGTAFLAGITLLTGCADAERAQIQALQQDNQKLARDKADLMNQLRAMQAERDQALAQQHSLAEQLRNALAAGPAERKGDWIISGPFAWTDLQEAALFDSGKAVLKSGAHDKLREVADHIKSNYPGRWVFVIGHTDTDPIMKTAKQWIDNLDLSINRGATVAREFQSLGLPRAHVIAAGAGEYQPKVDNTTKANKQQNRRVQVLVVTPPERVGGAPDERSGSRDRSEPARPAATPPEEG